MINWPDLLRAHHIEFTDRGPSTAKGNLYTKCPWCRGADRGFHLGIHLGRGKNWKGYGCWKMQSHRGKSARRLLSALLNIGIVQAQAMLDARSGKTLSSDDDIEKELKAMRGTTESIAEEAKLEFTDDIKPIEDRGQSKLFVDYLASRKGWTRDEAMRAVWRYKLRYAMKGAFSYRIVIPIMSSEGLLNWTGRTISDAVLPRYKSLSTDASKAAEDDLPIARRVVTDCLFNQAEVQTRMGRGLVICEGPLDAMRIDLIGRRLGVAATCLFGMSLSDAQIDTLAEVAPYYGTKLLLLDSAEMMNALIIEDRLARYGYKAVQLTKRFKDPGEMHSDAIEEFIERHIR